MAVAWAEQWQTGVRGRLQVATSHGGGVRKGWAVVVGKAKTPNLALRYIREAERRESREEFAAAVVKAGRQLGDGHLACDARLVARWEDGDVGCPRPAYQRALTALIGRPFEQLGFRRRNAIEMPSPDDLSPGRLSPHVDEEGQVRAATDRRTFLVGTSAALPTQEANLAVPLLVGSAADATEADARNVIAWAESTNISDDLIDHLTMATIKAAEDHISLPPTAVLARVRQLHGTVTTLLQGGRQRARQTRELLRLDAELLAHLCQLLGDVHRDRAASACGQAATVLAEEADSSPAAALSAQAQIARWRHRHAEAADLAAEGLRRGASESLRVLLAYQEATAAAAAGQARRARAAISRAEAADSGQAASDSAWSCPPARQALYRLGVELNLGHPREALQLADEAKSLWNSELPHAFGTWAHFQIVVANAHLMLGSADGAAQLLGPVSQVNTGFRLLWSTWRQ
jgi:hypothetical protein